MRVSRHYTNFFHAVVKEIGVAIDGMTTTESVEVCTLSAEISAYAACVLAPRIVPFYVRVMIEEQRSSVCVHVVQL